MDNLGPVRIARMSHFQRNELFSKLRRHNHTGCPAAAIPYLEEMKILLSGSCAVGVPQPLRSS